mmetsp:Transcript_19309/g.60692  ORF Transcript_19309/g.60692 Transcript_19309/m.60692 type:complete len:466 (-) Transcript_19309:15-1412(-)
MKFVCKGFAGRHPTKEFEINASERLLATITSVILDETGEEAQHCLYFEDVRMFGGGTLSEHIVELARSAELECSKPRAVCPSDRGEAAHVGGASARLSSTGRGRPWRRAGSPSPSPSPSPPPRGRARTFGSRSPAASPGPWRPMPLAAPLAVAQPTAVFFAGLTPAPFDMLRSKGLVSRPAVRSMLRTAKEILGYDPRELCMLGQTGLLSKTSHFFPSIFIANLVAMEELRRVQQEAVDRACIVAGPSLGGYCAALCAASVLPFETGLKLVKCISEAAQEVSLQVKQLTVHCIGVDLESAQSLSAEAARKEGPGSVCEVSYEAVHQCCVSGTEKAALLFKDTVNSCSTSHAQVSAVAIGIHTPLMLPVREKLAATLAEILPHAKSPARTIWSAHGPGAFRPGCDPKDVIDDLLDSLCSPVLWEPLLREVIGEGCLDIWEVGQRDAERLVRSMSQDLRVSVHHVEL